MPRRLAEESPVSTRRTPAGPSLSDISTMLNASSSSPSLKRRKVEGSPPSVPLIRSPRRGAPEIRRESPITRIGYTHHFSYSQAEPERRRLSMIPNIRRSSNISTSHQEAPALPPVSALTSSSTSSSEPDRPCLPSLFPNTHAHQPASRYSYETEHAPSQYNPYPNYRYSTDQQPPFYPTSPTPHSQYSGRTAPQSPLPVQPYPHLRSGPYLPRPSQSVHSTDRTPFSPPAHGSPENFDQVSRIGTKRRRGNLPRHVTDTLRSWLNSHITHPYPTEDEKQSLCQVTGLTMNQVCTVKLARERFSELMVLE